MKRLLISAFAVCFALAVPTAVWAADEHHGNAPQAGATSGHMHHTYQFHSSTDTRGRLAAGHHPVVDVSRFRRNVTAGRHFHWGDYRGPSDYAYRRWSYGDNLPAEYWVQDFWINNFLNFGLDAPPDGYVWVRYGPDALLIDEDTGEIVQVEYGLFY